MLKLATGSLLRTFFKESHTACHSLRRYAAQPKKFYKNTGILYDGNGKYEITLDQRKLKTPKGNLFTVNSEPLAVAIATEWDSQKDKINQSTMHLNALCCTAIDNPNSLKKIDMVNYVLNYIPTDTVLFQTADDKKLEELQLQEWEPVIEWFNKRYDTDLAKTTTFDTPKVGDQTRMHISRYLMSYSEEAIHGFVYAIDTLKSVVLSFAAIDRFLSIEKAVLLARLEEEFQLGHWGRVEWCHDLSHQDLQARLAAAVLFIHCNSENSLVKEKIL